MNVFISLQVWINDALNHDVVKQYHLVQLQDSRLEKAPLYADLYSDFEKFEMKRFFVTKSGKGFMNKAFGLVAFS